MEPTIFEQLKSAVLASEWCESWIVFVGVIASVSCVVALLTAWVLLPQWRTLQAYICLNEVIFGAIALCVHPIIQRHSLGIEIYRKSIYLRRTPYYIFLTLSFCWSVCASTVAYIKLVRVYSGIFRREKTIATLLSFILFVLILIGSTGVCVGIYGGLDIYGLWTILVLMLLSVLCINIILFIIICVKVMSCCFETISERNCSHIIALIGVGVVCQATAAIDYILKMLWGFHSSIYFDRVVHLLFQLRLVPLTIVILCNKTARYHWKTYIQRRRNVNGNAILLRTRQTN